VKGGPALEGDPFEAGFEAPKDFGSLADFCQQQAKESGWGVDFHVQIETPPARLPNVLPREFRAGCESKGDLVVSAICRRLANRPPRRQGFWVPAERTALTG
jgi:hypothetical protein